MVPDAVENERFELRGELGIGGGGAVYRVFDRERGIEVALKMLRRVGGPDLYRFKREFRALAGLAHPHLATLHELYVVGSEWMYTMELVEGVPFDQWVRTPGDGPEPPGVLDTARLRDALYQLADGLTALHGLGKLHRDLKPSNVLCEPSGRLVILDFGLIVEPGSVEHTHEHSAVGTLAYMSPEQAADVPLTPASDWYAVGVMLYEALTGVRPFRGATHDVLLRKQREDATPPSVVAPGVPRDLAALCARLLHRDPTRRPDGPAVLAALGQTESLATITTLSRVHAPPAPAAPAAMDALRQALAASRDHFVLAVVHGDAGSGKTALLDAFLDEARVEHDALTLAGADDPREQIPLSSIDQALDQLSSYFMALPKAGAAALLADAAPLARMFPALRRVPALQVPVLPQTSVLGPDELRRRAFGALRTILARLGLTRPVVLAFDNNGHVAGADARIFSESFVGPDMPHALVIASYHSDLLATSQSLADLRRWADQMQGDLRFVGLDPPDA